MDQAARDGVDPAGRGAGRLARAGLLALLLAACSTEAPILPAPVYRDTAAPFASVAAFEPARFAGLWYEIASYPTPFQAGCANTRAEYTPRGDGGFDLVNRCTRGGTPAQVTGTAMPAGPGRLEVRIDAMPFLSSPYWVLWVDEGYRTAVVGVPSGRAAWILDRSPVIPPDRLAAARQMLSFAGYDLSQLRMTPQSGDQGV
ncbi:lipocalin [Palleronia sediminis]|uniref:Outer membrane lipoprotein Blc n=1 Tax=Palleronia sediminis TaxID=2547833 RepID=A0A4R6A9V4_9RHOB|nr:lipocalin family protein [Palleronia sediminis]TDL79685.1 lipocalin [Palleronia sediminis]